MKFLNLSKIVETKDCRPSLSRQKYPYLGCNVDLGNGKTLPFGSLAPEDLPSHIPVVRQPHQLVEVSFSYKMVCLFEGGDCLTVPLNVFEQLGVKGCILAHLEPDIEKIDQVKVTKVLKVTK